MRTRCLFLFILGVQLNVLRLDAAPTLVTKLTERLEVRNGPIGRRTAAEMLGRQGREAVGAIPDLLRALQEDPDASVRLNAAWALGKIPHTEQTIIGLIRALEDPEWAVRHNASLSLTWIGEPAIRSLQEAVLAESVPKRAHAIQALLVLEPGGADKLMPPLVEMLRHDHPGVRQYAATTAGKGGRAARAAVPALIALLDDKQAEVRGAAITALGGIGESTHEIITGLIRRLHEDPQRANKIAAAIALGDLGKENAAAIQALLKAFNDKDARVRSYSSVTLGRMGEAATPQLEAALRADEPRTRELAAQSLSIIGPQAKGAVSTLTSCLADPDDLVRTMAADALGNIGVKTQEIEAALRSARDKEPGNTPLRAHCEQALAALASAN